MVRSRVLARGKPAASCQACLAWGVLPGRYCRACSSFAQNHEPGECAGCSRVVPIKKGYCRLCWHQASLEAKGQVTVLEPFLRRLCHHQLFLADLQRPRMRGPRIGKQGRRARRPHPVPPAPAPITGWVQLRLFDLPRDFTRFDRRQHANLANPWLVRARDIARSIGQARGWTQWVASDVDRALVILLSGHADGDRVRFSELFPALRAHGLSVERTIEVLERLGVFDDDRTPTFEHWLERKLADIAPGIRRDVEAWLRRLRDGGPRSRSRDINTVWAYLNEIQPILLDWSARYGHLREITRDDILAAADSLHGSKRHHTLSVLRSLFRHCKKTGTVFRDPAARVRIGRHDYTIALPLQQKDIEDATQAATTPAARLVLALAAVHAAHVKRSASSNSTTSTSATAGWSSPAASARSTSSPSSSCWTGSTTGGPAGPTPPTCT